MTTHRFFINNSLTGDRVEITDPLLINQWQKVLRFKVGDRLNLIDQQGQEVEGVIESMVKTRVTIKINGFLPALILGSKVNLAIAILKKENFELVVQKATEIGVTTITPLVTSRTVKLGLNLERLERIITEASEQSGRRLKPVINSPVNLNEYLEHLAGETSVAFSLNGQVDQKINAESINILIGPEGGWSEEEEQKLREKGVILKSLGNQVLRAETAAIVGTYLATHNLL